MSKYSDLVKGLNSDFDWDKKYKKPVIEPIIVGHTGIDPDEKFNASDFDHEGLSGLLGGNVTGHYHLTGEQLAQLKEYKRQIDGLSSLLESISTELDKRISDVESSQAEYEDELNTAVDNFNEAKESLTARLDVIAGQTTEDTEILDARVDAENTTHPNLGHNIRSIHQLLIDYMKYESTFRLNRDNDLHAQIGELSAAVLHEMYRFCKALQSYEAYLFSFFGLIEDKENNLYSMIDELSGAVLHEIYRKYQLTQKYDNKINELHKEIDEHKPTAATEDEVEDMLDDVFGDNNQEGDGQ